MQTSLFISIFIAAIHPVSGNSEVKMKNSTYHCCDHPGIPFAHHCSSVLRSGDVPFAKYKPEGSNKGCEPPCKEIQDGRILLEQCVDVQVSTVCRTWMDQVYETRTSFKSIPCSGSVLAPGSVGLLLLLLVFIMDLWTS